MKIVAITSSPKGKNSTTLRLVNAALEGAREAGAETEIINIAKMKINYCKGCVSCYAKGKCVQKDEYNKIAEKFFSADGVILSSPNYIDNVSAQLKTFLDRSANSIHEQLLDGKYGLTLTTSGGSEYEGVLKVMSSFINRSGGLVVGSVGFSNAQGPQGAEEAIRKAREVGKELVAAIKEKRSYPEQEAPIKEWRRRFEQTLTFNKERWAHNYQHWVEKGWIKA
ncbi:Multimeric flavodoxin WrbA [Methanocella conradii HZ254]|uniref:Multimeric flavodoxin WrbA n=1 Tax=Methanocella conradii (strain DSM 24694 / JCM 17849 / CGMCC 1.5162 / HZ254) TaxID=1041930 RepID=H8I7J7_METCZ|nr:flavodoxin family protein [Methanocella conradii]AFD01207.1 Multimeric flavodoxin WrbA [Methanocella conradii HZ254]